MESVREITTTKQVLRSIASVALGLLLWYILLFALAIIFVLIEAYIPFLANFFSWVINVLDAPQWYAVLLMGIPAIVPGIIIRLIMKGTSDKTKKWMLIVLIALIAAVLMFLTKMSVLEKIEGTASAGITFWAIVTIDDHIK